MENKFSWTQEYKRSWENSTADVNFITRSTIKTFSTNKKTIIRQFLVAIDNSASIEKTDYIPTIRNTIVETLPSFCSEFKRLNPLSIINFATCKNKFEKFSKDFDRIFLLNTIGSESFSFLNCLKSGIELLKNISYDKELLLITASTNTRDTDIYENVINDLKKYNIKINIISICGELSLFKRIAILSGGLFYVPLNLNDFEEILMKFTEPLESPDVKCTLVKLGFPSAFSKSGICSCHLQCNKDLYSCPACNTLVCNLPIQCPICDLQLVTGMHISKSYYYQYPLEPLSHCTAGICIRCKSPTKYKCEKCESLYCEKCGDFVENEIRFCPFC